MSRSRSLLLLRAALRNGSRRSFLATQWARVGAPTRRSVAGQRNSRATLGQFSSSPGTGGNSESGRPSSFQSSDSSFAARLRLSGERASIGLTSVPCVGPDGLASCGNPTEFFCGGYGFCSKHCRASLLLRAPRNAVASGGLAQSKGGLRVARLFSAMVSDPRGRLGPGLLLHSGQSFASPLAYSVKAGWVRPRSFVAERAGV